ncbi:hypothetical protein BDP55DRAFT_745559 [Colletotrichum godetiae]|uniref:Uncharacterized protein n=1 Tax=Colletotrichum godetiae TaxID=1209918 RepID=A0AAJ0EXC8_9PEZI|nr:uncharacterized protein BDP55DRAFT_745559 [Colletotrichum godetiae]KAK1675100.1 hypothetical protein BDP55DRAFT_745559 [Colletotrichum godetiae]
MLEHHTHGRTWCPPPFTRTHSRLTRSIMNGSQAEIKSSRRGLSMILYISTNPTCSILLITWLSRSPDVNVMIPLIFDGLPSMGSSLDTNILVISNCSDDYLDNYTSEEKTLQLHSLALISPIQTQHHHLAANFHFSSDILRVSDNPPKYGDEPHNKLSASDLATQSAVEDIRSPQPIMGCLERMSENDCPTHDTESMISNNGTSDTWDVDSSLPRLDIRIHSENMFNLSNPKEMFLFMAQAGPTNIKMVKSLDMWIPFTADTPLWLILLNTLPKKAVGLIYFALG